MQNRYAVIVAGGKGLRMGTEIPKQFLLVNNIPIVVHTLRKFLQFDEKIKLILVLPQSHIKRWELIKAKYLPDQVIRVATGGATRFDSVKNGLDLISDNGIVAIHDAVRPCISIEVIKKSFEVAKEKGNAIVAVPMKDSIRKLTGEGSEAVERSSYQMVQTPQTFNVAKIKESFKCAGHNRFTDDASVAEANGQKIHLVEGNYQNIKVTTPEDLKICEIFLSGQ